MPLCGRSAPARVRGWCGGASASVDAAQPPCRRRRRVAVGRLRRRCRSRGVAGWWSRPAGPECGGAAGRPAAAAARLHSCMRQRRRCAAVGGRERVVDRRGAGKVERIDASASDAFGPRYNASLYSFRKLSEGKGSHRATARGDFTDFSMKMVQTMKTDILSFTPMT